MKVLWLASTPCGAFGKEGIVQGGWMISLEEEMKKSNDVSLEVAFICNKDIKSFIRDGVKYYPICIQKKRSRIGRVVDRFFEDLDKENEKVIRKISQIIKESNPDIIHVHGTEGFLGLVYKLNVGVPVVYSIQGLLAPYVEKFYSGIPATFISSHESVAYKMRGLASSMEYKKMKKKALREMEYLENAQYIIGRTSWDKRIPLLFNSNVKYYVGDEILRDTFYKFNWKKECFSKKIHIVSTISSGPSYKGFETLLQAASLLKNYADFDFVWNVIGYTPKEKWVSISEKYKHVSCESANVNLLGRKNSDEMVGILLDSDIYVHVSHIENSPNSVCEAMLLGMPVIATNAGGTCSMLENEKEGILVQDGDPYVMAGAIVDYYTHFEKAKVYGENARKRALERHNPNRIGKQLLNAYKNIISDYMESTQHVDAFDRNIKK